MTRRHRIGKVVVMSDHAELLFTSRRHIDLMRTAGDFCR
ncbi:putative leader peptide [Saccharopolyspora phatthalungensis]|uniref:Uncharacterized protein n=1 Tax=Saccharopolyspora phatthalungensis TaxID=664693 RepID=A0A840QG91_9PSEU|nr:putative leader peptide [Saccharopolyspora phatthalungensis]MBB5159486.1 hypothetical protein [Saccharopolyspora phatthalungensis]